MKYVSISPADTLSDLTERVGVQNVDQILADNGLTRTPKIGKQWEAICNQLKEEQEVTASRKISILNQFIDNSDVYEHAALADSNTWKILSAKNTFSNYLYVSDQLEGSIPSSNLMLGNDVSVLPSIYVKVQTLLANGEDIDPNIFSVYSTIQDTGLLSDSAVNIGDNPMSWFNIPLDKITLYSSLYDASINIPAFPESVNDTRNATYAQMPDLLYQYEPWQMYQSSGPKSSRYEFHLHRDMWTGNHNDGKANELIRFCQAQCYPKYSGSAVFSPTVTLYVAGNELITGVMNSVSVDWTGPLGHDSWYLEFTLALEITEVSSSPLSYEAILSKPIIG